MPRPLATNIRVLARDGGGWMVSVGTGRLFSRHAANMAQLQLLLPQAAAARVDELRRRELAKLPRYHPETE